MAGDPRDVNELQKALNDASGKASALWTTFVTFTLYLAIAFGSVTHRDLFLEKPVTLPILNVALPLTAFFAVAPTIYVIFHFYVCLQLYALTQKAADYNSLIRSTFRIESDRQFMRQRVDPFPIVQFLAGPRLQQAGGVGFSLRFIGWITLVGSPVVILLLSQIIFLPYHLTSVTWVQRVCILLTLIVIWFFWRRIRAGEGSNTQPVGTSLRSSLRLIPTAFVAWFSLCVAHFPGEAVEQLAPAIFPTDAPWRPNVRWVSANELIFGRSDGHASTWLLANRLYLVDEGLVDVTNLEGSASGPSLLSRDFAGAIMVRADLRKANLTGSNLTGADLSGADLRGAKLGCFDPNAAKVTDRFGCTTLRGARLVRTKLTQADLAGARAETVWALRAELQGANLAGATLRGAFFEGAHLEGASLESTELQGASLTRAHLQGAVLDRAIAPGGSLAMSSLAGAVARGADFRGADFHGADLRGADLEGSRLSGADFHSAKLQAVRLGASTSAVLDGVSFFSSHLWRATVISRDARLVDCRNTREALQPLTSGEYGDLKEILAAIADPERKAAALQRVQILAADAVPVLSSVEAPRFVAELKCEQYDPTDNDDDLAELFVQLSCDDLEPLRNTPGQDSWKYAPLAHRFAQSVHRAASSSLYSVMRRMELQIGYVRRFTSDRRCDEARRRLRSDVADQLEAVKKSLTKSQPEKITPAASPPAK